MAKAMEAGLDQLWGDCLTLMWGWGEGGGGGSQMEKAAGTFGSGMPFRGPPSCLVHVEIKKS